MDVVYTWVDGSDPAWRRRKHEALECSRFKSFQRSATSDARFFSRDELRFSLRSLNRFAPFVDKIHLVTDGQIPDWLDREHPKIKIVFHQELFERLDDLPTFNSHAIEANLHRIPELSEQFIYLNDDFLFYDDVDRSDFFDSSGRSIVYFDRRKVIHQPWWFGYHSPVQAAARNNSRLLAYLGHAEVTHRLDHVPYALHKSVIEELWRLFPEQLAATSTHRFRHPEDLSVASSLAQHYALATQRAVRGQTCPGVYVKVKRLPFSSWVVRFRLWWHRSVMATERKMFFSINDSGKLDQSPATEKAISRFFESTYPHPSPFELAG